MTPSENWRKDFREKFKDVSHVGYRGDLPCATMRTDLESFIETLRTEAYEEGKKKGYEEYGESHAGGWLDGLDEAHENGMRERERIKKIARNGLDKLTCYPIDDKNNNITVKVSDVSSLLEKI